MSSHHRSRTSPTREPTLTHSPLIQTSAHSPNSPPTEQHLTGDLRGRHVGARRWTRQWARLTPHNATTRSRQMAFVLWILAVILVISGIVTIVRGGLLLGVVLIIVGLLVGPGGVSLFTKN
jgi:hypothetical protein